MNPQSQGNLFGLNQEEEQKAACVVTIKNIKDLRCLSMCQHRLLFCQAKALALIDLSDDADLGIPARTVLSIYLQAFGDWQRFLRNGEEYIRNIK